LSKYKDRSPFGDWEVRLIPGTVTACTVTVAQAWYERVKGGYVFHDDHGICYDFPPGSVAFARRAPTGDYSEAAQ
jgi:hypothetical protein